MYRFRMLTQFFYQSALMYCDAVQLAASRRKHALRNLLAMTAILGASACGAGARTKADALEEVFTTYCSDVATRCEKPTDVSECIEAATSKACDRERWGDIECAESFEAEDQLLECLDALAAQSCQALRIGALPDGCWDLIYDMRRF